MNHRLPRHRLINILLNFIRKNFKKYTYKKRLDAGSFGTMGVGSGFAIAAALQCRDQTPEKRVVCIQGDSAFGFGGMEIETAFRYNLPIIFIIFNNNGIYGGLDQETFDSVTSEGDPCLKYID